KLAAQREARVAKVVELHGQGVAPKQIAARVGVTEETVREYLIEANLIVRQPDRGRPKKADNGVSVSESAKASQPNGRYEQVRELHAHGLDAVQIARRLGLMPSTARKYLKELGLS